MYSITQNFVLSSPLIFSQKGNTALHLAAKKDQGSCVSALLSQAGVEIGIKNIKGYTAIMVAQWKALSVFDTMIKTCKEFPADSYGKVVLCGNSGAGKSTLTQVRQVIINILVRRE